MKRTNSNNKLHLQNQKTVAISTIIPVYNAADFLRECLDSVLNQQGIDLLEIICIDDCSTDNSLEILNEYAENDKRITVISNDTNKGAGESRNIGIDVAKGKYLHFLDADDWVEPDAYSKMYNCMKESKADFCICLYNKYDNVTKEISKPILFTYPTGTTKHFEEERKYFFNTSVVPWNKLYDSNFVKRNNIRFDKLVCANDRTFYFDSMTQASKIAFVNDFLINYRINNSKSLVGQARFQHFDCHFDAYYNTREKIYGRISDESKKIFTKTSILDILSFYHKVGYSSAISKQVEEFFFKTKDEINQVLGSCNNEWWYSEIEILCNLHEIDTENCIPVVFATNNNYAPYMAVAIQSLIANTNISNMYRVYILYSELEERYISTISKMAQNNVSINFVNVSARIEKETKDLYSRAHYSKEMYYRILIPEIFRPFKKVVYLDCDIIIKDDIANMFNIEIGNSVLGGVSNISSEQMSRYISNQLKLNVNEYINSGILIFNCNEFRNNYIKDKCFSLISQNSQYVCPDQDILNLTCSGKIYYLDMGWNFQWYYNIIDPSREDKITVSDDLLSKYNEVIYNHKILHFTSGVKAWNSPDRKNAFEFWEYATSSPFLTEIICKNSYKIISFASNRQQIEKLTNENRALTEKLEWNRNERLRLSEENKSLLTIISSKWLNNSADLDEKTILNNDNNDIALIKCQRDEYLNELIQVRKSLSFKIGRFVTWIPRKIRSVCGGNK